jgi:hypothetical protein
VASWHEFTGRIRLYDFGENRAGGTRFSFPALAGIGSDGRIVFGNDAVSIEWQRRFQSAKAGLIFSDQSAGTNDRWARLGLSNADAFRAPDGPSVVDLLYSACIGRALALALPSVVPQSRTAFLSFSVGAPLDGTGTTRSRFAQAFAAGILLAETVEPAMDVRELIDVFAQAWSGGRALALASEAERRVHVRAESQLLVKSLAPIMTLGRSFLIADIGATTTELAVLRRGTDRALHRWATISLPLGVDAADRLHMHERGDDVDLLQLRIERVHGQSANAEAIERLALDLSASARRVAHLAVKQNKDPKGFRTIHVCVAGGGSRIKRLKEALLSGEKLHPFVRGRVSHEPRLPGSIEVVGASSRSPAPDEVPELICVAGAASSPDEDEPYSDEQFDPVDPDYSDPLHDLSRQMRAKWT